MHDFRPFFSVRSVLPYIQGCRKVEIMNGNLTHPIYRGTGIAGRDGLSEQNLPGAWMGVDFSVPQIITNTGTGK